MRTKYCLYASISLNHIKEILLQMLCDLILAVVADTRSVRSDELVRHADEECREVLVDERLIVFLVQTGELVCGEVVVLLHQQFYYLRALRSFDRVGYQV